MTKRGRENHECYDLVDDQIEEGSDEEEDQPINNSKKRLKKDAEDSPSNASCVHNGQSSPSTVNRKPRAALVATRRSLAFAADLETGLISGMATKRLKALCSVKEPTGNMGIEMVGAAQLSKLTSPSSWSDEIELAMKEAVQAPKVMFQADHLRNNGQQLLFKSQKSFHKLL